MIFGNMTSLQALTLAANELVWLAFFLVLFLPCAWLVCQLALSLWRDLDDLRGLCSARPRRRVVIDRE